MMTYEMAATIMTVCVVPMLGVVTKYIVAYLQKKTDELENKSHHDEAKKYLDIAENAVCTAVTAINQTMVDALKKNGTFDAVAQQEVFGQAKQQALCIMGSATQDVLKEVYNDMNVWLNNKIEYYVSQEKK